MNLRCVFNNIQICLNGLDPDPELQKFVAVILLLFSTNSHRYLYCCKQWSRQIFWFVTLIKSQWCVVYPNPHGQGSIVYIENHLIIESVLRNQWKPLRRGSFVDDRWWLKPSTWNKTQCLQYRYLNALLLILIRMDPELFPGSESGIIVPDPAKLEEQKNKILIYNFK